MKLFFRITGVFYFGLLFYIFFLARRRPSASFLRHRMPVNIVPIRNKIYEISVYAHTPPNLQWVYITDLFGNIALFIPLPFFLAYMFNLQTAWQIIGVGCIISACVEFLQFVLSIGVADVDDIILNTLGTAIGYFCYKAFRKIAVH